MIVDEFDRWALIEQIVSLSGMMLEISKVADEKDINRQQVGLHLKSKKLQRPIDWGLIARTPTSSQARKALAQVARAFGLESDISDDGDDDLSIDGFADNLMADMACILDHIEDRKLSSAFVLAWGNFRAADLLLQFIVDDLAPREFDNAYQGNTNKAQQYWYALWVDHLIKTQPGLIDRGQADQYLANILLEIIEGKRLIPAKLDANWFLPWVEKMLFKNKNATKPSNRMGHSYGVKAIAKKTFPNFVVEANSFARFLPPIGESRYPKSSA